MYDICCSDAGSSVEYCGGSEGRFLTGTTRSHYAEPTSAPWSFFEAGAGNLVALLSDASYPTIETDPWMDMTPDVVDPSLSQNISNDQAFIDEIPDFDAFDEFSLQSKPFGWSWL